MLHPYPRTPEEATKMALLVQEFKACKAYSDRLDFWTKYHLEDCLYYSATWTDGSYLPVDLLNKKLQCRTWEDALQLNILTLTPENIKEAKLFSNWAMRIRPGHNTFASAVEELQTQFEMRFSKIKRNRETFFANELNAAKSWADDVAITNHMKRENIGAVMNLDFKLFSTFIRRFNQGENIDLANFIPLYQIEMDWKVIDTYIFAKSKYEFAIYLENYGTPINNIDKSVSKQTTNVFPSTIPNSALTHEQAKEIIKRVLEPLSGLNPQKNFIMTDSDYSRLVDYTEQMVLKDKVPLIDKPFLKINISVGHIRYTFYRLHKELFEKGNIRDSFIDFLHSMFKQFNRYALSTTKKQFSIPPKSYTHDFKVKLVK